MAQDEIETALEQFFVEREGEGVLAELRSIDLVAEGLLDSIDTVILAAFLEEKTGIDMDLTTDEALAAMRSFDGLVALAAEQTGAQVS